MVLQSASGSDSTCKVVATGHGDAEWCQVDRRLREYARHRSALDAAEAFDLVRAEQLKIYVCCGCAHLYEYMERVLGYKPHAARERMRVARSLATLPERSAMTRQRLEEIFEITLRPRRIELGVDWEADSTRPTWDVAPAEEGGLGAVVPGGADG